ncbi:F-box/WD repeat-containing protein 9-like [Centruroides vittatus]|uniref:F-box/WD repeat-containing protein 9-like n=1 Tax=Centruroides vittatus TaxID=120091 RepID=UPI003510AEB4
MLSSSEPGNINSEIQKEEIENHHCWNLETIPTELFLLICSFLDAKFVIRTLSQVNKRFYDIIKEYTTWKFRITKRWPKKYPIVSVPDELFDWKKACVQREEQYKLWSQWETRMSYFCISRAHYAAVDVVHFLEGSHLFVSGSRDRSLKLWDISKFDSTQASSDFRSCLSEIRIDAHQGWIWSLASAGHQFYSGGWDANIKCWDMKANFSNVKIVNWNSAILCLDYFGNLLTAGTYGKQVLLFDPRTKLDSVMYHANHKRAVLCIAMDDNFIITGSEDQSLIIFDKRNRKLLNVIKFQGYPMSLSYGYDHLWVGDKQGVIHLIDPTNEKFNLVETYKIGHVGKITGISHSLGSVITCSTDKTISILEPNADPEVITKLSLAGEIAGIANVGQMLVSANSDCSIGVWLSKI